MERDRRRHARYERADLVLEVAHTGIKGILTVNPHTECMNFSLAGLQFGSSERFKRGDRLILDLRVQNLEADELRAEVISSQERQTGEFCTGVRFCFEEKPMQRPEISHVLLQIEDKLRLVQEFPLLTRDAAKLP
jgi:hypothetical protein